MGYIRHNAIIVTSGGYVEANEKLQLAHQKAVDLFGGLVTPIIISVMNDHQSFFVAPDGSKEYWDTSYEYTFRRESFADYVDSFAYDDGSNPLDFVDVGYDEEGHVEVDRKTARRPKANETTE
jgi:hypothetical protein